MHRHRAGDLEGHLRGVDRVVGAVEEPHAHALHRVAGDGAVLHRLAHALLDRRDEARRDDAALDLVDELEASPPLGSGSIDDVAVAELAAAAASASCGGPCALAWPRIVSW